MEKNELQGIAIYPNPNAGVFHIDFSKGSPSLNFEVYNLLGKQVWSERINSAGSAGTTTIDLTTLSKGIYMYKLSDGQKQKTGKIELVK